MKEHIKYFDKDDIVMECGDIVYIYDEVLGQKWDVSYNRLDLNYSKFAIVNTLEEAFEMYEKWHNNIRGA